MLNLAEKFFEFSAKSSEQPTDKNGKVLLVDGLNAFIRNFVASNTMGDEGDHVGGITGFLMSLAATIRQLHPTRVIIAFDGKGGSQRRRAMFSDYKGKRRSMTKLNRTYDFATLEDEVESRKWQIMTLITMLNFLPVTVVMPENVEADDVLAYFAQIVEERGGKAIILSSDKDFLQLVNDNITVWNPVKKKMYTPEAIVEDYGIHPNNFLLYRAVTGDASDCIPGVEGIKEKTLLKYFPTLREARKWTVDDLLLDGGRISLETKKSPVALTKLLASREQLELNARLMRLDEVAMGGSTRIAMLDKFDAPTNKMSKLEFTKFAASVKMTTSFGNFDQWFVNSWAPLSRYSSVDVR